MRCARHSRPRESSSIDGRTFRVDGSGINGLTRVYTGHYTGEVTVRYAGTIIQKLADILSFQFVLGLILMTYTFYSIKKELYG